MNVEFSIIENSTFKRWPFPYNYAYPSANVIIYIYKASCLLVCLLVTFFENLQNSHISANFQARSSKFGVVVYPDNTQRLHHVILYHITPKYTLPYQIPTNLNINNLAIFQDRGSKFGVVPDLDNTQRLHHVILYHTIPNYTLPYQIPTNLKLQ